MMGVQYTICYWATNRTDPQNLLSTTLDVPLQLSTLMIVDLLGDIPSLVSNSWIQRHSQVILLSAMYSASIVDSATVGYFFEYQEIAPPPNMMA